MLVGVATVMWHCIYSHLAPIDRYYYCNNLGRPQDNWAGAPTRRAPTQLTCSGLVRPNLR
jgi:hypothetical protein